MVQHDESAAARTGGGLITPHDAAGVDGALAAVRTTAVHQAARRRSAERPIAPGARDGAARSGHRGPTDGPRLELVREPAGITGNAGTAGAATPAREIAPGRPLPLLRVLRVPPCEPEYDPPGAVVIPFPARFPAVEPTRLRLVGAPDPVTVPDPDPTEARLRVRRFAVLLTEVLSGARPLRQLSGLADNDVRQRVARLHRDLGARQVTAVTLVASNATAPTDDTAEGFLRLRLAGPDRFQAVAVRLERTAARAHPRRAPAWVCTALRYR